MIKIAKILVLAAVFMGLACTVQAAELSEIKNYVEYSPTFSSAGQPNIEQLELLKDEGFERVVYIAFSNSKGAIANEDQVVKELGMDYVQVPVVWDTPLKSDFYAFAGAMKHEPEKKTLLHCQANYRASAFAFLYRVLYKDVPASEAREDMLSIWEPDGAWETLVQEILDENGIEISWKAQD